MIDHDDSRGESIYDIGTVPEDGPAGDTAVRNKSGTRGLVGGGGGGEVVALSVRGWLLQGGAGGGAGAAIAVVTHSAADAGSQKVKCWASPPCLSSAKVGIIHTCHCGNNNNNNNSHT